MDIDWQMRRNRRMCWLVRILTVWVLLSGATQGRAWERLAAFQNTLTEAEIRERLDTVYAPQADWARWIELSAEAAWIRIGEAGSARFYRLDLRREEAVEMRMEDDEASAVFPSSPRLKPLKEWTIALDPGHLGGPWGPMEHRSFAIGTGPVVQEGDLVLAAARRLEKLLHEAGATVVLIRENSEPRTRLRPEDLREEARAELGRGRAGEPTEAAVTARAASLFYGRSEIQARADWVNSKVRPDLVIALHIDAAPWPDGPEKRLVERNTGHILVNGSYFDEELADEGQRLAMMVRLLQGWDVTEAIFAREVATEMDAQTEVEPFVYRGRRATALPGEQFVYSRNLMANRLFEAPVIYLEPWTLNSAAVYPWAAEGDYEGERGVDGRMTVSLPAAYARFVFDGIQRALGESDGTE